MSIQIGDELDLQNDLLDDTDARLDSTAARMSRAGRNLDKVAKRSKEHGESTTNVTRSVVEADLATSTQRVSLLSLASSSSFCY